QFWHSRWFTLFTPDNIAYQLLLDYPTWKFYVTINYLYKESKHSSRTLYNPSTGQFEHLFLSHSIYVQPSLCEAQVHPDIVFEVDDEVKWVEQIVNAEGPVHVDEVSRRLS